MKSSVSHAARKKPVNLTLSEDLSVPSDQPGAKVGSLTASGRQIIDALDELFSRA